MKNRYDKDILKLYCFANRRYRVSTKYRIQWSRICYRIRCKLLKCGKNEKN